MFGKAYFPALTQRYMVILEYTYVWKWPFISNKPTEQKTPDGYAKQLHVLLKLNSRYKVSRFLHHLR